MPPTLVHASSVRFEDKGLILLGGSNCGKSDLTLRLIDCGGELVADDQVLLVRDTERLVAVAPPRIAGLIEIRGLGIMRMPYVERAPLDLAIELLPEAELERLPPPATRQWLGVDLPMIRLDPKTPSACAKIRCALTAERVA